MALNQKVGISSIASISPLGDNLYKTWEAYTTDKHLLSKQQLGRSFNWVATLPQAIKKEIQLLRDSNGKYRALDDTVLYAILASRNVIEMAGWSQETQIGINIGSSRGATGLFEKYHAEFIKKGKTSTLSSPTTTLGNISSWVAHDLGTKGPVISHSITCSTALHALLNGVAWICSGLADKFVVGGSEAPLTPFTVAQMHALKIYTDSDDPYPCRALDMKQLQNSMVLGEAASMACLENNITEQTLAVIEGIGYATEPLQHNVSISADAICFQQSMRMAIGRVDTSDVDVIVMHAPGTIKGDNSELSAINKIFDGEVPAITGNKWKIGHTFGASGMLSIELAILMMMHQQFIPVPYLKPAKNPQKIRKVLINAVGFGGNAVSILLGLPSRSVP